MDYVLGVDTVEVPFRTRIKLYQKRAREIEDYLTKKPKEWGKFQSEFNSEVNTVFRAIMIFERKCLAADEEYKVYKLKRIFINKFRSIFARGEYVLWSLRKPFGYAGDFKIIDDLYRNCPTTTGFDRLFDNYTQMSAIAVAVRNRKEDFKRLIVDFVNKSRSKTFHIMDLAAGPCRDVKELLSSNNLAVKNLTIDCYDNDERAIEYAKSLLSDFTNVNFFKENAVRVALKKDINSVIGKQYNLIYSTGLFDYLGEEVATRLVKNLRKLLTPDGVLLIANVRDKFSNPSVYFMEWAADWNLVYRSDEEFRKIFINAGFKENEIETQYEQQGILQYVIAFNRR
jgi:SAM-dependent methyltransferase